jgi:hypothetical protein
MNDGWGSWIVPLGSSLKSRADAGGIRRRETTERSFKGACRWGMKNTPRDPVPLPRENNLEV